MATLAKVSKMIRERGKRIHPPFRRLIDERSENRERSMCCTWDAEDKRGWGGGNVHYLFTEDK